MKTKPFKPTNANTISPYLIVENVEACISFLENTFDAKLEGKLDRPNGTLMHAEVVVGDSLIMLGEPMGEFGPIPAAMFVYVPNPENTFEKAKENGGEVVFDMMDQPHAGVKYGGIKDPYGNIWWIGKQIEDISWEEQQRRINATAQLWSTDEI